MVFLEGELVPLNILGTLEVAAAEGGIEAEVTKPGGAVTEAVKYIINRIIKLSGNELKICNVIHFVSKIILTYCEKKMFYRSRKTYGNSRLSTEFAKCLVSLGQFIQIVKGQNNFNRMPIFTLLLEISTD